jgi:hypothetical protein
LSARSHPDRRKLNRQPSSFLQTHIRLFIDLDDTTARANNPPRPRLANPTFGPSRPSRLGTESCLTRIPLYVLLHAVKHCVRKASCSHVIMLFPLDHHPHRYCCFCNSQWACATNRGFQTETQIWYSVLADGSLLLLQVIWSFIG